MAKHPPPTPAEPLRLGGAALESPASVPGPRGGWHVWLVGLLVVELLATLLDIALGPWSVIGFEEGRNARAAMQLACGHTDRIFDLQYRDFCGGCTGVAVLGAPLLRLLGATVAIWKLVPAAFHVGLVLAVAAATTRSGSPRGAVWAVAVLVASPWALRELALTGWGNHAEVRVFLVAAVALLLGCRRRGWTSAAAGLLVGLSIWFAHIAMHAVPALLMLVGLRGRRGLPFLLGLPIGLLPWGLYLRDQPTAVDGARQMWRLSSLASPVELGSFLLGPLRPSTLWPSTGSEGMDLLLAMSIWAMVGLALMGIMAGLRARVRLAGVSALAMGGLVLALFLRPDLWSDVPHAPGFSAFHLRYRAVLWPWLAIGVALATHHLPRRALWVAVPFLVLGTGGRVMAWSQGPGPTLGASVWSAPGRPDATVPEGDPPRRNPWALDRMVDITAAMKFVAQRAEPLPECTADHEGELGRRIGLHVRRGGSPALQQLPPLSPAVIAGVAWGWTAPAGKHPARSPGSFPQSWQTPVATAVGRWIDRSPDVPSEPGDCLRVAQDAWDRATWTGRVAATEPPPPPPAACPDETDWTDALRQVSGERGRCPLAVGWPTCD